MFWVWPQNPIPPTTPLTQPLYKADATPRCPRDVWHPEQNQCVVAKSLRLQTVVTVPGVFGAGVEGHNCGWRQPAPPGT